MLSPSANVAPPAAPRLPGPTPQGSPTAASTGLPSFSQMLSDQAEPAPPTTTGATPRPADKAPADAAPTGAKPAPTAARKESSVPRSAAGPARRDAASDGATTPAAPAAGLAGQAEDGESAAPSVDATATDDGDADAEDAVDAPQVSGLNEFTQLIGLPPSTIPAPVPSQARLAAAARDGKPGADAQRVDASTKAAIAPASASDATAASDAASPHAAEAASTYAADAADTSPTGAPNAAAGATASASPAPARRTASSADEDTTTRPRLEAGRVDTDKPSRNYGHRATEPGIPRESSATRATLADLSAKAAQEQTRTAEAVQATASGEPPAAARPGDNSPQNFAALMAQNLAPASAAEPGAPAASGRVHASMHSAAFAPELAAQVSLLAVDGVQTAQLQLNPAEMGPVAVQIVVDGAQAQVSFQAAQADTRQALEQSLPDLAAALQGQGLTLSGGGVFQQAPRDSSRPDGGSADGPGNDGTRAASRRVGATESMSTAAGLAPARRARGLLDTFA